MKLIIASDIHGSAYYCEKLMNVIKEENPQKVILLGDLLYHGPRNELPKDYNPKKVIEMLNGIKNILLCVKGNCDAQVDQMVLDFPIMAEYAYIAADGFNIFATHGHVINNSNPPALNNGDILLHGHTHVPADEIVNNYRYINPGSVSIPKEGSGHSYIIFENGIFTFKTLE